METYTGTIECVGDDEYALVFSDETRHALGLSFGDTLEMKITADGVTIRKVSS
jgi:bifunctional DNA-binding transcriptional regulator/antitoxin component of YhaV-PrlF toxin-antitoxin module